ncbi:MAG: shikimate kinase [Acidimicrobiales bacterium]
MTERLVLVGMMGAGKSTVGRLVAERLGWRFVDVDAVVEREAGTTIAELFATRGEDAFRVAESTALAAVLADDGHDAVVSVGGGAVVAEANRRALRDAGTVVWLRARPETLARRVGDGLDRPLLAGTTDPATRLEALAQARRQHYEAVADVVVDVDELSVEEVASRVRAARGALREPS